MKRPLRSELQSDVHRIDPFISARLHTVDLAMTKRNFLSHSVFPIIACGLLATLGLGCSSPEPTSSTTPPPPTQETGPSLSLLYTTADAKLVLHNARRDSSRLLATGATAKEARAVSHTGRYLAFSYATADS